MQYVSLLRITKTFPANSDFECLVEETRGERGSPILSVNHPFASPDTASFNRNSSVQPRFAQLVAI